MTNAIDEAKDEFYRVEQPARVGICRWTSERLGATWKHNGNISHGRDMAVIFRDYHLDPTEELPPQEAKLLYVAITRATRELVVSGIAPTVEPPP